MYHGMDTSIYFNPMAATDYKRADRDFADLRLGGIRFLTSQYTTEWNAHKWAFQGVRGTVRTKVRSMDADLDFWFRGAGNVMRNVETSQTCNWDGTDCYFARIYPSIEDISHSAGSPAGG